MMKIRYLPLLVAASFSAAVAAPTAPVVVSGQASFSQQGNVFSVTNSPNAIINWQSFSINAGEVTRFLQQSADSAVLNRIIGQDPSQILGALQSNGRVFLINPNGIMFGKDARIDVGGLTASTLNLANSDFLAGKKNFSGANAGKLTNAGTINGGQVYLIASSVENSGVITSPNGQVVLAAGHTVQLVDSGNPDMHVVVSAPSDQALNLGQIMSQGGKVGIYGALVNQRGVVNANSAVQGLDGKIVLKASREALVDGASLTTATGVGKGGDISVLGDHVGVSGTARIVADGATGGGTVLVGGGDKGADAAVPNARGTYVGADTVISADAGTSGNGGKVIVWGTDVARAYGTISARGVNRGGYVETSGHQLDVNGVKVLTGSGGTWLLDPFDINIIGSTSNINTSGTNPITYTGSATPSNLNAATVVAALNAGTSVIVDTTGAGADVGDITVQSAIAASPSSSATLTLKATRNILINGAISSTGSPMDVVLTADQTASGVGDVIINAGITTNNANFVINGGKNVTVTSTGFINTGNIFSNFGGISSVDITTTPVAGSSIVVNSSGAGINTGGNSAGAHMNLTADTITLSSPANAHSADAKLTASSGGINSNSAVITAAKLEFVSTGTVALGAANHIGMLSGTTAGGTNASVTINNDTTPLTIGNVGAHNGIVSSGALAIHQATAGGMTVDADVQTVGNGIDLSVTSGSGTLTVNAGKLVSAGGSGSNVTLGTVSGALASLGTLSAPGGNIGLNASASTADVSGALTSAALISISGANGVSLNSGAVLNAGSDLDLTSSAGPVTTLGTLFAPGGHINIAAPGSTATVGGGLTASTQIAVAGASGVSVNAGAVLGAGTDIGLTSSAGAVSSLGSMSTSSGHINVNGATTATVTGALTSATTIAVIGNSGVSVTAPSVLHAGTDVDLSSSIGPVASLGSLTAAAGHVAVSGATTATVGGPLVAASTINIGGPAGVTVNADGVFNAGSDVNLISSTGAITSLGSLSAASGNVNVDAGASTATVGGPLTSASLITIAGHSGVTINGDAVIHPGAALTVVAANADAPLLVSPGAQIGMTGGVLLFEADKMTLAGSTITASAGGRTILQVGANDTLGIQVDNPLTGTIGTLSLYAGGAITQQPGAVINSPSSLQLHAESVHLAEANSTGVIAGRSTDGDFVYRSINAISVSPVDTELGIHSATSLSLRSDHAGGITQTTFGPISASSLALDTIGPVVLVNGANAVGVVGADLSRSGTGTGAFTFVNNTDYAAGDSGYAILGVVTNNHDILMGATAGHQLTLNEAVNAGTARFIAVADKFDSSAVNGVATASQINVRPASVGRAISVGSNACAGACLALTGLYNLHTSELAIGSANPATASGNISVTGITNLATSQPTDRYSGTTRIGLLSGASVTGAGAIDVLDLGIAAGSGISLTGTSSVTNFAASTTTGGLAFKSAGMNITSLAGGTAPENYAVTGVTAGSGGIILTTTTGNLVVNGPVNGGAGAVHLSSGAAMTIGNTVTGSSGGVHLDAVGSVTVGNAVQAVGDMVSISSSTGTVAINAPVTATTGMSIFAADNVNGAGQLTSNQLDITAGDGIGSAAALNTAVHTIYLQNNGLASDIRVNNVGALDLSGAAQNNSSASGAITVHNVGALTVDSDSTVQAKNTGAINLVSHGPMVITGSVLSSGAGPIHLEAEATGNTTDKLTITSGGHVSSTGAITLSAGDAITVAGTVTGSTPVLTPFLNAPPPPPEPTGPTLSECIANPTTTGCNSVLPSLATCETNPSQEGCSVVLPTISACISAPTTAGCSFVLPTLDQCVSTPAKPGCSVVLPPVDACISTPTTPGCVAVLPTIDACVATPTLAGCVAVLPGINACVAAPALPGCSVVLPTINACIATPTLSGCLAVLPSLGTCVATPTVLGCSVVLPTFPICISTPAKEGCSVVLPTLIACTSTPTLPGCSVVLPSITVCIATPAAAGCSAVLPSVSICTATPTVPGCSVVLPTLAACTANPVLPGCSAVLPSLNACVAAPASPGCTVVLPTLTACIATPGLTGCSVVLPTLATCTSTPSQAGCSVVLPGLSACTANPAAAGCSAVLPTVAQCTSSPTLQGCSVVLPPVATCQTDPTLPGCTVVVPPLQSTEPEAPIVQAINVTVNLINSVTADVKTPTPVVATTTAGSGGASASGNSSGDAGKPADTKATEAKKDDKKDEKSDTVAAKDTGAKKDEPVKKLYCN